MAIVIKKKPRGSTAPEPLVKAAPAIRPRMIDLEFARALARRAARMRYGHPH
jgi:hypothetical protein